MAKTDQLEFLTRFNELLDKIDLTALTVLKGHLVIEERLNTILEHYVFNADRLDTARLSFQQKLELCRGFAIGKSDASIWELIAVVNRLRNAYAHSLDASRHEKALQAFDQAFKREMTEISAKNPQVLDSPDIVTKIKMACAMCLGYLRRFEEDSKRYRDTVDQLRKGY